MQSSTMHRAPTIFLILLALIVLARITYAVSVDSNSVDDAVSPVITVASLIKSLRSSSSNPLPTQQRAGAGTPTSRTSALITTALSLPSILQARKSVTGGPINHVTVRNGGSKLNGERCGTSSECKGSRECLTPSGGNLVRCTPGATCVCLYSSSSRNSCQKSSSCDAGERCVRESQTSAQLCWSCKLSESSVSAVDDGNCSAPCISIDALSHLDQSALVFRKHREADVLCDANGSCATAGHIVVHNGKSMMMGSYCKAQGDCVEKRMLVNSPRLSARNLRVASKTNGLEFTALSARHETQLEERVMRALVKMGW